MKTRLLIIVSALFSLGLAACSPAATPYAPTSEGGAGLPAPQATAAPAATALPAGGDFAPGTASLRLVIKNAEMNVLVSDVDQALPRVTQMAADYGGYVVSSQTWDEGEYKRAALQLAVPSAQFEAALNQLRGLGVKVLHESASGQDVSAEYVDLRSRLTNLEATAARVREFLAQAKTVEESLRVNQQLSELEAQIEQVKGQMQYYEGRAAFSTIALTLTPDVAAVEPEPTVWDPSKTFERATDVLVKLAQVAADGAIWLGVLLGPVVIVILIGLALVIFGRRALRRGRA